jgi:syntaxin 8
MANANQLFLIADHIKLSILERQRAQALNLTRADSERQDTQIQKSLAQLQDGLKNLQKEHDRLHEAGDDE